MKEQRWLRIIPVALIMYTISYVDRTNVSLALDPEKSTLFHDLGMNGQMKGESAGIFFWGYLVMQIPGGYLARHWSARKFISLCLITWGIFAVGCGVIGTFRQFELMRFLLGVAESGVYPATLVLLYHWFPRAERARATAYWNLCQPVAVVLATLVSVPMLQWSGWNHLASRALALVSLNWTGNWPGWKWTLVAEGLLPFLWLPIWWFFIRDHPREARWISLEERDHLEATLAREAANIEPAKKTPWLAHFASRSVLAMIALYFLHNCAAYGCMTFFSESLNGHGFGTMQFAFLFAFPYAVTALVMVLLSRHSDRKQERRMHVAFIYALSGVCLILSVLFRRNFYVSYAFMCLAIPGPFSGMAPFWANAGECLPPAVMGAVVGLVNAFGNVGGYYGPKFVGWLSDHYPEGRSLGFVFLGIGMLGCTVLAFFLPKAAAIVPTPALHTRPIPSAESAE